MTDLTVVPQSSGNLVTFDEKQIALIKRTICKPKEREATNDELALFVGQCKRTQLDPFAKQIYAIFRKSKGVEQMTIQTGIDGFRLIAERTGHYLGKASTLWCGQDEVWHEVWNDATPPIAAKVTVRKIVQGHVAEIPAVAHWREYAATNYDGSLTPMWKNMPANQLAKCAEALALRQAFPNDLSGLYTADEMAQAAAPARPAPVAIEAEVVEPQALDENTRRAVEAAIDEAGVDEKWLKKELVAIGVENVNHPHFVAWLTEAQATALMARLSAVVDERTAAEEADGDDAA